MGVSVVRGDEDEEHKVVRDTRGRTEAQENGRTRVVSLTEKIKSVFEWEVLG